MISKNVLAKKILATITKENLLQKEERVLLAVSGGADSLALLHILVKISQEHLPLTLFVAHLNHGLRQESAEEAQYVSELSQQYKLPFFSETLTTLKGQTGLEEKARKIRYNFLEKIALQNQIKTIAVAHHLDDQAETVLVRVLKGSGIRGLGAMNYQRPLSSEHSIRLIRPLLDQDKLSLQNYLEENKYFWYEDQSNLDLDFERNRIRHQVLPFLEKHSPPLRSALVRIAKQSQQTSLYLKEQAEKYFSEQQIPFSTKPSLNTFLQRENPQLLLWKNCTLENLPEPLLPYFFQKSLSNLDINHALFRANHYKMIQKMGKNPTGKILLPEELVLVKTKREIIFYKNPLPQIPFPISLAQETKISPRHMIYQKIGQKSSAPKPINAIWQIEILSKIEQPLSIRAWQPGEKIRPLGKNKTYKIADLLAEMRVPALLRKQVPILVDAQDSIIALVGVCLSEKFEGGEGEVKRISLIEKSPEGDKRE